MTPVELVVRGWEGLDDGDDHHHNDDEDDDDDRGIKGQVDPG